MSAEHRKLTRLTSDIFEDLPGTHHSSRSCEGPSEWNAPLLPAEELRAAICEKLKRFRIPSRNGGTRTVSLTTVGDILRTSPLTLLHALDPLLTYAILVLLKRICQECGARPVSCLKLLKQTSYSIDASGQRHRNNGFEPAIQQLETSTTTLSSSASSTNRLMRFLPTGLLTLDSMGGVREGSITEIVGRPGVGKTQLALQLLLMAARYNQGAMYIDTEKKLILGRLREMATRRWSEGGTNPTSILQSRIQRTNNQCHFSYGISTCYTQDMPVENLEESQLSNALDDPSTLAFKHPDQVLRNVAVKQPKSTEELLQLLEGVEEDILHRTKDDGFPVRVLIVDSIAAPLNRDFGADLVPQRAATAFSIAQTLKRYAERLNLAVIVINQAGFEHQSSGHEEWKNDQTTVRAALGTSWHHCVSTRILVEQMNLTRDGISSHSGGTSHLRSLSVVKSNWMPYVSLHFEITPIGIVEVEDYEHDMANTDRGTMGRMGI